MWHTAKLMFAQGIDVATAEQAMRRDHRGFVYVITHPAFPGYVKIGRAFDSESRLAGYQTGCPFRSYELEYDVYFDDCHFAEGELHARLAACRAAGEWFQLSVADATDAINQLREII